MTQLRFPFPKHTASCGMAIRKFVSFSNFFTFSILGIFVLTPNLQQVNVICFSLSWEYQCNSPGSPPSMQRLSNQGSIKCTFSASWWQEEAILGVRAGELTAGRVHSGFSVPSTKYHTSPAQSPCPRSSYMTLPNSES